MRTRFIGRSAAYRRAWTAALLMACTCLTGCAMMSQGTVLGIPDEAIESLRVGVTTKDEVIAQFGRPHRIMYHPSQGMEVFTYMSSFDRSLFVPFPVTLGRAAGSGKTVNITFVNDVVADYQYTIDQRGIIWTGKRQ
jgi:outer membrane protein assembly factor BamE (lipoprotein component of BamABCDE complex)